MFSLASCSSISSSCNREQDFLLDKDRAERWSVLRQDSGDPFVFAPRAKEIFESLGMDYRKKTIIFSDNINVEKALKLKKQCDEIVFQCKIIRSSRLTGVWKRHLWFS